MSGGGGSATLARMLHPALAAAAALLLAAGAAGQIVPATPDEAASFVVRNIADSARRDVVTMVLPFARGAYRGEPLVLLDGPHAGQELQSRPLGAPWPDGSVRFALAHSPVRLIARQHAQCAVGIGGGVRPRFMWTDAVLQGSRAFSVALRVGETVQPFSEWAVVDSGHLAITYRSRLRVPGTPIWAEFVLRMLSGCDHARFWFHYGDSDPGDPDVVHDVAGMALAFRGALPVVRHASDVELWRASGGGVVAIQLQDARRWADGQSQAGTGALLFGSRLDSTLAAELQWPVFACGYSWPDSGAFGPWGYVPPPPPAEDLDTAAARAVADYRAHAPGAPWSEPVLGLGRRPGNTGDQRDFTGMPLTAEAFGYAIERLHAVQRSVLRDAARPTHLRASDASPVRFGDNPDVLLWTGRPDPRISRDMLGKSRGPTLAETDGWAGRDRQHWTVNYLATYALLTGDPWALAECDHLAELWLGEMRVASGSAVLDGTGPARATGRTLKAGTLLYLVTGRPDLAARIAGRVDVVERDWAGRDAAPVRPIYAGDPDPRKLGGAFPYWTPWEEGFAVMGLDAVARVFGNARAAALADAAGRSLLVDGFWSEDGVLAPGDAVAWLGGARLTPEQYATHRAWAGPGFNAWAAPAASALLRYASDTPPVRDRAQAVLDAVPDDWRSWEWKAVR